MIILKKMILGIIVTMLFINFVFGATPFKTSFEMKAHNLNRRLIGHTLGEFSEISHHDCARECMSLKVCKSIDFHIKHKICKLNDADSQSVDETEFEVKGGAVFSDITEWPSEMVGNCASKPCTSSQRCVSVGDTFKCIEMACSLYPEMKYGEVVLVNVVGDKAEVRCEPGHYADGGSTITCQGVDRKEKTPSCMKATDCFDVLKLNPFAPSGLYDVKISETEQLMSVYCDMDTEGGGWTVFQRRFDGSVDFFRNFVDYENGFGNKTGEFWLGLKTIQEMTMQGTSEVRLDVLTADNRAEYVKYSDFKLLNGGLYELSMDKESRSGTVSGDSFGNNAGYPFSTKDRDQDGLSGLSCAGLYRGAWWYHSCSNINLNGLYEVPGTVSTQYFGNGGVIHREVDGHKCLKETKMMFRRT